MSIIATYWSNDHRNCNINNSSNDTHCERLKCVSQPWYKLAKWLMREKYWPHRTVLFVKRQAYQKGTYCLIVRIAERPIHVRSCAHRPELVVQVLQWLISGSGRSPYIYCFPHRKWMSIEYFRSNKRVDKVRPVGELNTDLQYTLAIATIVSIWWLC